jgi:hypothetical protein
MLSASFGWKFLYVLFHRLLVEVHRDELDIGKSAASMVAR